jgi:CspA family cold shock protein
MFKAIRNLVRQRSRDSHQGQPQVIEEDDSREPRSDSDVPPRLAEPELEGPSGLAVRAQVKWFNPNKGYGFVQLSDGSGDAFLHVTALAAIGVSTLQPGETLEFRTAPAQRGLQVTEVISVDSSTAAPPRPPRTNFRSPLNRQPLEASVQAMGTVKWYNSAKGFGFIAMDSGGRDVFVHASALQRAGITSLSEGQRVFIGVVEGRKGPEAESIQVA